MSAEPQTEKHIHLAVIECQKRWNEMWLVMSDNDITKYNALKAMDVIDFWTSYDVWKEKMDAMRAQYESNKRRK